MSNVLLSRTWMSLGTRQGAMIEAFYDRFFARFPRYRAMFPQQPDERQLHQMLEVMSLVARLGEQRPLIAPRLAQVGDHHRPYNLDHADFANFRDVFLEVLGEQCGAEWSADAAFAWRQAFDQLIIPLMTKGHAR